MSWNQNKYYTIPYIQQLCGKLFALVTERCVGLVARSCEAALSTTERDRDGSPCV